MAGKEILFLAFLLAACSAGVGQVSEPSTKQTINVPTNNFPTTNLPKNEAPKNKTPKNKTLEVNGLTEKVRKPSNGTKEDDDQETSSSYILRATLVRIPYNENPYNENPYLPVVFSRLPDDYNGSPYGGFSFSYTLGKGYGGYQGYKGPGYGDSIYGGYRDYNGNEYIPPTYHPGYGIDYANYGYDSYGQRYGGYNVGYGGVSYGGDTYRPINLGYGPYLNPIRRAPYSFNPYKYSYITSSTRYSDPHDYLGYRYNLNGNQGHNLNGNQGYGYDPVVLDRRTTCKDVGAHVEASDCCSGTTGRIDDSGYDKCCLVQGTSCAYAPDKCCGGNVCSSIGNPGAGVYVCVEDPNNGRYSISDSGTDTEEQNAEELRDEPSMDNEKGREDDSDEGRNESPSSYSDSRQENINHANEQLDNNGNSGDERLSGDTSPNDGGEGGVDDREEGNEEVRGNNKEGSDGEEENEGTGKNENNFWIDKEPEEEGSLAGSTNDDPMMKRNSGYQNKSHPSRRNIAADRNVEDRKVDDRKVEDRKVEDSVIIPIANLVTV